MPRIIGGSKKKMILKVPEGGLVRPTTDRIKENVFNIINADIAGSLFLDLFAGSGQIGLESLSRGAYYCVFIEKDSRACSILRENIVKTGFKSYCLIKTDAMAFIHKCDIKFDLIYIDPPYNYDCYQKLIDGIIDANLLNDSGKIIIEHARNIEINDICDILEKNKEARYGNTVITVLKKRE